VELPRCAIEGVRTAIAMWADFPLAVVAMARQSSRHVQLCCMVVLADEISRLKLHPGGVGVARR
jgi:hypothetical protein